MSKKTDLEQFIEQATNAIDESKIIFVGQNSAGYEIITLNGKDFEGQDGTNLQNEAKLILNGQLWPILHETLRKTAQVYMFTGMKTLEDAQYGKALLYNLDIIHKVIKRIAEKKLSPQKNLTPLAEKP